MSIRTMVIDDEPAFLGSLEAMLDKKPHLIEIVGEARSVAEGLEKIAIYEPELVFLDIQMTDGTGFDLLERCPDRDFKVIFITAFDRYAIEAFKFAAVDYLLKPVLSEDLWNAVERARQSIQNMDLSLQMSTLMDNFDEISKERKKLVLRESDTLHVIRLEDILYCSADGSYTSFYLTEGREIIVSIHLKEYENLLQRSGFFRVHRSHLVNLAKIVRYEKREGGQLFLEGDLAIPVSVRKKDKLLKLLSSLM